MANSYFKFKQFTVYHDQCAMKVGTDGVLLGAYAPIKGVSKILDIGTGTGLIALMLAQRSDALLTAIEIDADAVKQAQNNVTNSPWPNRVEVLQSDFRTYQSKEKFDLIVSNPPYFVDSLTAPSKARTKARHTDSLSFTELIQGVVKVLDAQGKFVVILPTDAQERFCEFASHYNLFLNEELLIQTRPGVEPKRVIMQFSFNDTLVKSDVLLIEVERHKYSEDYIALTRDFYLKM